MRSRNVFSTKKKRSPKTAYPKGISKVSRTGLKRRASKKIKGSGIL